ncbi:hypothetical protein ACHAXS_011023 [Conticribra weissflogii]
MIPTLASMTTNDDITPSPLVHSVSQFSTEDTNQHSIGSLSLGTQMDKFKLKRSMFRCIIASITAVCATRVMSIKSLTSPRHETHHDTQQRHHLQRRLISLREVKEGRNQTIKPNHANKTFSILCTTHDKAINQNWGSYLARCVTFKRWVDQCASSIDLTVGRFPSQNPAVNYNATMYHKGIPPERDDLGKVFIDVVDDFTFSGLIVPKDFEIIVQNEFQSEVFPHHNTHIIEHWYNTDPSDTYVHDIAEVSPLKVGTVCFLCPYPGIPSDLDVNFTFVNEFKEGIYIEKWYPTFMASKGWTEEKTRDFLKDNEYGMGILYYDLFRTFDVMIITPKPYKKQRYGSIQRITSAMKSGVPVLVEAKGPAFEAFVDRYNYPCVYADSGGKYPTLREALVSMQNVTMRIKCQKEGLQIAEDFSPEFLIKKLLHTMGYEGSYKC